MGRLSPEGITDEPGSTVTTAAGAVPGGGERASADFLEEPLDGVGAAEGWADRTFALTSG